ncbi:MULTISPECIES: nucleobase:cation symporter-2 family protein [Pacificibacter]|uniref:nucleobase:cation symporter-2 family protein n=1 Tax=Pacificibacter TaxID=1042323 RepID=UPI001C0A1044|nr:MULTISPECIES: nucleobase:cation symporter-2 family protein [Pacificibacter]MBU2936276.1 purine permease [Pacificibacter marinus]MDO6616745.1 nucleobase:cation symporter-2 family protein [Pacificibacter sp. 1_MG-2023]
MSEQNTQLVYNLNDVPPPPKAALAAFQHVLASIVGIATPSLIIGGVLGLGEHVSYLIAMAFFVSGVATFIQCRRVGPVGSGLLSVQGTSFAFLGAILAAGFAVKGQGGTPEDILAMIFGLCLAGSLIEVILSQFLDKLKRVITPTVTGVVITVIGLSLIKSGFTDFAGGAQAGEDLGKPLFLLLGLLVVAVILFVTFLGNPMSRIAAIMIGLIVGTVVASFFGLVNFGALGSAKLFALPVPFKYGIDFDFALFVPIAFLYFVTAIETSGDLTANSVISGEPVDGEVYMGRIKGGVLGDGVNSAIAAVFNTFPNTTFSQNNGVIQMTGVASRHVGMWIGGLLALMGLFPVIGAFFLIIPKPVLGGATVVLFASIAVAGIRILASQEMTLRRIYIMAVSFGLALGVTLVPDATQHLPNFMKQVFAAPITLAGLSAIILSLAIPEDKE